jgi:hypothetical protein
MPVDPRENPFSPGAGTQPPELAGREQIVEDATIALDRAKLGRSAKSQMLLGLRGVGKTVLLNRIVEVAEAKGFQPVYLEAPEDRSLVEMLVPPLRRLLFALSRKEKAKVLAKRGLGVLRSFAKAFKVKVGDIEFSVDAEEGVADSGSLEADLPEVLLAVTRAAQQAGTAVALFIDEVQYLAEADLGALIVAIHRTVQKGLPFVMFGAGLPQLAGLAGEAKSYAERLFDYPEVGPLSRKAIRAAVAAPIERAGATIDDEAVDRIRRATRGYPYFLQEWGKHAWNEAGSTLITADDVRRATRLARKALDKGFFRVRLDRLTPREKQYMRAMAELGPGPHRSGEIAHELKMNVTAAGPLRANLIHKGMIYSPQHGDTAFTVPMFDEFMRRSMPDWSEESGSEDDDTPGAKKRRRPARVDRT